MCLIRTKKPDKSSGELPDMELLDKPLLMLSEYDPFTVRHAFEGVQVFAGTGGGKTLLIGQSFFRAFMRQGFGGLVMTVKPEEYLQIEEWAKAENRENHLIRFAPDYPYFFRYLEYEAGRQDGSDTETVVSLFMLIIEIANGSYKAQDSYWMNALRSMLRNMVDLLQIAGESINVINMYKLVVSAANSSHELASEDWRNESYMYSCMRKAAVADEESPCPDLDVALLYWTRDFPNLAEKTRSIIVSMFTTTADAFLRGTLRKLFSVAGKDGCEAVPEWSRKGAIIVLDLPIKQYGIVGKIAQGLYKLMWQQAMERTQNSRQASPVFLFSDENQSFINSFDLDFQQTARSARVATCYLTQNISNYHVNLGDNGENKANSLLGNLSTKIFLSNSDPKTNEWASQLFSERWVNAASGNQTIGENDSVSSSFSKQKRRVIEPIEFTQLRRPSPANGFKGDAIIHQVGNCFSNGQNYLKTTFTRMN